MAVSLDEALRAELESKIAYLERANSELSDVVYRQQQEIQAIQSKLAALLERFEALGHDSQPHSLEDERPPHY